MYYTLEEAMIRNKVKEVSYTASSANLYIKFLNQIFFLSVHKELYNRANDDKKLKGMANTATLTTSIFQIALISYMK